MNTFAQSHILFSTQLIPFKLKKGLSIETSFTSRRGLSLVSQKSSSSRTSTNKPIIHKKSIEKSKKKIKIACFQCPAMNCQTQKSPDFEQLLQLKPKKIKSINLRQRHTNLLSKDTIQVFSSTDNSYRNSRVQRLWNIDSPVNKLL